MEILKNIYPDAVKFLEDRAYDYDARRGLGVCFVKRNDQDRISYEELDRIGLVDTAGWKARSKTDAELRRGMWLLAVRVNTGRKV
jgi:hypothetical protein